MRTTTNICTIICAALGLILAAGCSNDTTLTNSGAGANAQFRQIDRLGRPGTNMIFAVWANHDTNNRNTPSDDTNHLANDVTTFMTTPAGRSAATAAYVKGLLVPDTLIADISQTSAATFLGTETGGKIASNGQPCATPCAGTFGGRDPQNDVIDALLGLAFGNTATVAGGVADDGKEQNGQGGTPNLVTDGVGPGGKHPQPQFPYLGVPL